MGRTKTKTKRDRRKDQERRERNWRRQGHPGAADPWWDAPFGQPAAKETSAGELAEGLVQKASGACLHGAGNAVRAVARDLANLPDPVVDRTLTEQLRRAVTAAWNGGWMPADLVRLAGRDLAKRHVRLLIDAIADEMRAYSAATVDDRWQDQLDAMDAGVWWSDDDHYLSAWGDRERIDRVDLVVCAIQTFALVRFLPVLEPICPAPGKARRNTARVRRHNVDEKTLNRVRGLLAKAESTDYPAEAETFTSAAQSLMAKHSIDAAMLAAESGSKDEPEARRVGIESPYEPPKALLLAVVAEANRCRAIWSKTFGFATLLGFHEDMEAVELLFTSLLVQATAAMTQEGSKRDRYGRSRTRSFRQSFLNSFAIRIGERLREAAEGAVKEAAAAGGGSDLLPVLAAREAAVEDAMEQMFPKRGSFSGGSVTDREGWIAGHAAADLATLHGRAEVARG